MAVIPPKIDDRNQEVMIKQMRELILYYCHEWGDIASLKSDKNADTLIKIFSRMMEIIIQRLNRVPDKNFLTFLDLMGVRLSPPRIAIAPLVFTMASGARQYGFIPAGTQAATKKGDKEAVIFETEKDLTVILPGLVRAVTLSPEDDRWRDHNHILSGEKKEEVETIFRGKDLTLHRLYLGHSRIFGLKEKGEVTLEVALKEDITSRVRDPWEVKWYTYTEDSPDSVELNVSEGTDRDIVNLLKGGSITFTNIGGIPEKTITGFEKKTGQEKDWTNKWIFAELKTPVPAGGLPEIDTIRAGIQIDTTQTPVYPDKVFFNNIPVDLTKDFYPFGERPKFNNTFYIGSTEVFSKEGADITIDLALSGGLELPDTNNIRLRWEFYNGSKWEIIGETTQTDVPDNDYYSFSDTTNAFTQTGLIKFSCPSIGATVINGEENYWIRIRIIGGDYGEEAKYVKQTDKETGQVSYDYVEATFKPPSINSMTLKYTHQPQAEYLDLCMTYNDFTYEDYTERCKTDNRYFTPFHRVTDVDPALYLAFDKDISTLPVTIFFNLHEHTYSYKETQEGGLPVIAWEYWTGKIWSGLTIEDNTKNLTRRELIQFLTPADLTKRVLFETEHYWIRARLAQGGYDLLPKLMGIYTNTVWAHNLITVHDEIIGSSNGNPEQTFQLSHFPVINGQTILVRETALTQEERRRIIKEEGDDAIIEVTDEGDNIIELWVRWHEADHFFFSSAESRHYIIDNNTGKIRFGDGEKGMIPPVGKDNIRCGFYRYGGGAEGNVKVDEITKLRTSFPYIDAVTNPIAADGGADQEDLDRVRDRGTQTIKHRERAVTYEDFEWIVREASSKIAKVKALATTSPDQQFRPGWITIIIVPDSKDPNPLPGQELIKEIEEYLFGRTSTHLTTISPSHINLIGPGYIQVWVEAKVEFTSISEAKIIEGRIINRLKEFFHPLYGGPDGGTDKNGWEFGRDVYISEVYETIEAIDGVDYVIDLSLKGSVQIFQLFMKEAIPTSFSYPRGSSLSSDDNKIELMLAEEISQESDNKRLTIFGFKEGDRIILSHNNRQENLILRSVSGDILECETFRTDTAYPEGSIVITSDEKVRSFILNEVCVGEDVTLLKIAIFEAGDRVSLSHDNQTMEMIIDKVTDKIDTIYIEDNYLVYSGEHIVNKEVEKEMVFPYLINTNTREIHNLKNEQPNCRLTDILTRNERFIRELDETLIETRGYDYCRWCFGAELSKR